MKENPEKKLGKVYLVGAGPGAPGLLTLRGREILERAEVVFYDHLVHPDILKFCSQARWVYVGKVGHGEAMSQEEIERHLLEAARTHEVVVRLKGGDPFIFGRGGEEAEALTQGGVPFEVVPGVSSAIAVPAYAGIPLTHRDYASSVTFVTGHEDSPTLDWTSLAAEQTLVFLMAVRKLKDNFAKLMKYGSSPLTPAAIIEWGTYGRQRTFVGDLNSLPLLAQRHQVQAPAVVVVGEVVRLREKLAWFEFRPLFGRKILITRAQVQAASLKRDLEELGAQVVEFPTIQIQAPENFHALDQALQKMNQYEWILFSSVNGVNAFFRRIKFLNMDFRVLGTAKIAAVGPGTAGLLEELGFRVERRPSEFTTDAMGRVLKTAEIQDRNVLFPRAEVAREAVVEDLRERGARVEVVPVYRTGVPHYTEDQLQEVFGKDPPQLLTFGSRSTVENFYQILKDSPYLNMTLRIPAVVIGPVTAEAAKEKGFKVLSIPTRYTMEGLVATVLETFDQGREGL